MAFIHGRGIKVTIDGVDLSAFTNTNEMTDDSDVHDVSCFGAVRKAYISGLGDGTFVIGGVHSNTALNPRATLKPIKATGALVTFIYQPEGTGSGKTQSSVSVLVKQYVETGAVADTIKWKATLQMSGTLNEAAQS